MATNIKDEVKNDKPDAPESGLKALSVAEDNVKPSRPVETYDQSVNPTDTVSNLLDEDSGYVVGGKLVNAYGEPIR